MSDAASGQGPVVIATWVHKRRLLPSYGSARGGRTTFEAGAVMADDLSPHTARIMSMLSMQGVVSGKPAPPAALDRCERRDASRDP